MQTDALVKKTYLEVDEKTVQLSLTGATVKVLTTGVQ